MLCCTSSITRLKIGQETGGGRTVVRTPVRLLIGRLGGQEGGPP